MFGRRKKDHDETAAEAAETETEVTDAPHEDDEQASGPAPYDRSKGPWDASEREIPEDDPTFVDVGALIVQGRVGLDLQIPTDPETGVATSVVALAEESAVELRAFAAPRGGGLWDEIRPEIIAEVERVGGKVEEVDSTFGRELRVVVPVQASDGRQGVQESRIIGVDGPRWLLRATFMGKLGSTSDPESILEQAVRDVVVVRGSTPMPPREQIPVVVPAGAVRAEQPTTEV
ncbi:DUF3710 domain-containing protein [Mumia zhuanghuii]|uniref:DUF3710 domain-containing protein n=1 Tax=Mumia zhuanghuii TaxID=2585211 RepID=A0A5C4MY40_9ACTN|nr:DUF3710 domain-containing protein [Mumia zhuanghuii]TNC29343.1 DUF3710 domain-containing protein [Mumia zhuanghuii]TNC49669.1 DUF3710 domain-containing protein [Mumia zhuanghuii]